MSTKYYLQNNLIIRGDIGFSPEFVVYNIENGESYQINANIFLFLYLISNSNDSEVIKKLGYRNIERLKKLGFISSSYSNNKVIIHPQTKFNVKTAYYPREVEIHLTSYCNLQCKHCVYDIKRDSKDYIRTDYLLPLVDEMEKMGVFKIILSGGEPLIHKDIMKILDKLKDKRLRVEILTNAISINTEMAIKLASKNFSITCSLDGYNAKSCDFIRGKGSFEKILKSIRNLNQAGARHNICCVINRLNFKTADKIIKLGEKLKTYSVNFLFLDPMGRAEKLPDDIALKKYEIIEFIKTIKKIPSKINVNFLNPLDVGKGKKSNIISPSFNPAFSAGELEKTAGSLLSPLLIKAP